MERNMLVGVIKLWIPIEEFNRLERERIADTISSVAADILKGASLPDSQQWVIRILKEDQCSTG